MSGLSTVLDPSFQIDRLVTSGSGMAEVLASGRSSETTGPVVLVKHHDGSLVWNGRWEIADGHHRVADALRAGRSTIVASLEDYMDDEPYEAPFFDFSRWGTWAADGLAR